MRASDTSSESTATPERAGAAVAAAIEDDGPAESAIFCEECGYRLDGLPAAGNCPECGTPVALSTTDNRRTLAPFEERRGLLAYTRTAASVLLRPSGFFRTLRTRVDAPQHDAASRFCWITLVMAGIVGGVSLLLHLGWTGVLIHVGFWPPIVAIGAAVA
ncbi:MAG: zinc ribbon domain-containing protein [Planctomycetota bacterium]